MRDGLILCERSAGRLARNVVLTGKVLLNGKKRRLDYGIVVSISYFNRADELLTHHVFHNQLCNLITTVMPPNKYYLITCYTYVHVLSFFLLFQFHSSIGLALRS